MNEQPLVEVHEEAHLVERAAPVLGRERVHRQPRQADVERAVDGVEQGFLARGVPVGALEPALLGPAPVAVHDHRDVRRDVRRGRGRSPSGTYPRRPVASGSVPWTVIVNPAAGRGRTRRCSPTSSRPRSARRRRAARLARTGRADQARARRGRRGPRPRRVRRRRARHRGRGRRRRHRAPARDRADRRGQRLRARARLRHQEAARRVRACSTTATTGPSTSAASTAAGSRASPRRVSTPKRTAGRTPCNGSRARRCTSRPCCARSRSTSRIRSASPSTARRTRSAAWLVAVGNGPAYAGGMHIAPSARLDDGLLDVTVVGAMSKPEFLVNFPKVFKGTHVSHPKVHTFRGTHVELAVTRRPGADGGLRRRRARRAAARRRWKRVRDALNVRTPVTQRATAALTASGRRVARRPSAPRPARRAAR